MIAATTEATPDFNRIARLYRWMEWVSFGPLLGQCRNQYLAQLQTAKRALIFGDGDGRFTARLLASNSAVEVDAVDGSQSMLNELLRRSGRHASRLRCLWFDARAWEPAEVRYSAIATHFFLDCLTTDEVSQLAARVRSVAAPRAVWVVSDFAIPNGSFNRLWGTALVRALYLSFAWMTGLRTRQLPDHAVALAENGFRLVDRRSRLRGLLFSELWTLR